MPPKKKTCEVTVQVRLPYNDGEPKRDPESTDSDHMIKFASRTGRKGPTGDPGVWLNGSPRNIFLPCDYFQGEYLQVNNATVYYDHEKNQVEVQRMTRDGNRNTFNLQGDDFKISQFLGL